MTNYIILTLCIIIILSYIFDITARYTRIPGVIMLIALGIISQIVTRSLHFEIPNLKPVLPVIGTLGLLMIVLEASLDLKLERRKRDLIIKSVISALVLFGLTALILSVFLSLFTGNTIRLALLNAIPVAIISSAVAIPSSGMLGNDDREFVVYESSFSDIIGIVVFDLVLLSTGNFIEALITFSFNTVLTLIIAVAVTAILAFLLHKITHHVNYIIIMTSVVMIYVLAKMVHLPALLLVLAFGMILSNNRFLENTPVNTYVDFNKFRNDLVSFKKILGEMTFLVRSFFFLIFGYYVRIDGLFNPSNLISAIIIVAVIFGLRYLFFLLVPGAKPFPLFFFAPRGLITILLFLSIPAVSQIQIVSEELITLVILFSIAVLTAGNILWKKKGEPELEDIQSPAVITVNQVSEPDVTTGESPAATHEESLN